MDIHTTSSRVAASIIAVSLAGIAACAQAPEENVVTVGASGYAETIFTCNAAIVNAERNYVQTIKSCEGHPSADPMPIEWTNCAGSVLLDLTAGWSILAQCDANELSALWLKTIFNGEPILKCDSQGCRPGEWFFTEKNGGCSGMDCGDPESHSYFGDPTGGPVVYIQYEAEHVRDGIVTILPDSHVDYGSSGADPSLHTDPGCNGCHTGADH